LFQFFYVNLFTTLSLVLININQWPHPFLSFVELFRRHNDLTWQNHNLTKCQITPLWRQKSSARSMERKNECGHYHGTVYTGCYYYWR